MRPPARILILSRSEAQDLVDSVSGGNAFGPAAPIPETWALLSIVDSKRGRPDSLLRDADLRSFRSQRIPFLECCFGDILPLRQVQGEEAASVPSRFLFCQDEAERIIAFLNGIQGSAETLIIHCGGGVSRSGAVGLFACRKFGLDEAGFLIENPRILPNPWVLQVLCEIANVQSQDLDYWYGRWRRDRGS